MESPTRIVSIESCLYDLCVTRTLPHYFIIVEEGGNTVRSRPISSHRELDRALFDGLRFEHFSLDMAGKLRSQFNALGLPEVGKGRCLEYLFEGAIQMVGDDNLLELPVRVPITRRIA